jgi:hypothetical protein
MHADAPRLLIVAHATPRPITDGPGNRTWQLIAELAATGSVRLLTVADRPINQQDWRALHATVPDTTLVRRGRIGRYTRLGSALDQLDASHRFHLALLTAPSLLSVRDRLPACPVAVDLAGVTALPRLSSAHTPSVEIALGDPAPRHRPHRSAVRAEHWLDGSPRELAQAMIAGLHRQPADPRPLAEPIAPRRQAA